MMAIVSVTQSLGYWEGALRGVYPKVSMYLLFVNTCVFLIGKERYFGIKVFFCFVLFL